MPSHTGLVRRPREAVTAAPTPAPYTGSAPVAVGECRWIRFATWNTVREAGCDPREGSLTANLPGLTCVPGNYAADDGTLERSLGTKAQGEACTYTPAATEHELASTDCAQRMPASSRSSPAPFVSLGPGTERRT